MKEDFLGIIPSRAGSKGIKKKSMAQIGEKALIEYTIEAAVCSSLSNIMLSTNDPDVIALAIRHGLKIPFIRPEYLCSDTANMVDVVIHALDWLKNEENYEPDAVVLLQPSSPFRDKYDIDNAIKEFKKSDKESFFSVIPVMQHPCDMISIDEDNLKFVVERPVNSYGRQCFPIYYFIDGSIYIITPEFLRKNRKFVDKSSDIYVMDEEHGIDIDNAYQLKIARGLNSLNQKSNYEY